MPAPALVEVLCSRPGTATSRTEDTQMHAPHTPTRAAAFIAAFALAAAVTAQAAPSAEPSPSERIRCQRALEKVSWSHRSESGGSSFEQAVPEAVVQRKAEDAVLQTAALRRFWGVDITPEQLQAELDRIAAHSKSPARLRELFAALGNDPVKAAECLARPLLADRLVRTYYAHDERMHEDTRARAEREAEEFASSAARKRTTGVRSDVEWRRGLDRPRLPGVLALEPDEFDARVRELASALGRPNGDIVTNRPSPLREDDTRFYVTVVHELDDQVVRLTTIEWLKRPFDSWWNETREQLTPEPERHGLRVPTP